MIRIKLFTAIAAAFALSGVPWAQRRPPGPPPPLGAWHYKGSHAFQLSFLARGKLQQIQKAISEGADVNLPLQKGAKTWELMWTPLYWAVEAEKMPLVEFLLAHNASVESKSAFGVSVLRLAATLGSVQSVKLLLDHGANPNDANKQGEKLLETMTAMKERHDLKNHYGQIIGLLKAHGAKS